MIGSTSENMDKRKVLFYQGRRSGCDFYRILQPARALLFQDDMHCAYSSGLEPEELQIWVDKSDAIVSMQIENEKFLDWMEGEQQNGRKMFFDYDDDPFSVSPFNPSYEKLGTKEVKFHREDGSLLGEWRDGVDGFNLAANIERANVFKRAFKQADLITTTNQYLASKLAGHAGSFWNRGKKVKVIRNMLNLKIWKPLPLVKDDKVRIIYQGGWSHFKDWQIVRPALKKIMDEHKNVVLLLMGQTYEGSLMDLDKDRIERYDWMDVEAYPYMFRTLNADIGICPLEKSEFNLCKSELKWEEYSALEIPSICSQYGPYSIAVDHGTTGFLAKNEKEWTEYLDSLIRDKSLRIDMGKQARKRIEERYDISKNLNLYVDAFRAGFGVELVVV